MPRFQIVTPSRAAMRVELAQFREYLAAKERRYQIALGFADAQPVANNRNRMTRFFLDNDFDFLLSIDSDTVPIFNPLDYVEADKDIVGFPYPTWRVNSHPPLIWFPRSPSDEGLIEVESVGGGCMLIARRVFEHPDMRAPFMDEWDADGFRTVPEDTTFCLRAREAGFKVWCAMDRICAHFKTVELVTLWRFINETASDL